MLDEYLNFSVYFKRVFNNADIPESDDFTPEVLEKTYGDMKIKNSKRWISSQV